MESVENKAVRCIFGALSELNESVWMNLVLQLDFQDKNLRHIPMIFKGVFSEHVFLEEVFFAAILWVLASTWQPGNIHFGKPKNKKK